MTEVRRKRLNHLKIFLQTLMGKEGMMMMPKLMALEINLHQAIVQH